MVRGLGALIIFCVAGLTASVGMASPQICHSLPQITKGQTTPRHISHCLENVKNQAFDIVAFMICKDLNKIAKSGATATDVNSCLQGIQNRHYNYKQLRRCKAPSKSAKSVMNCIQTSSV